MCEYCEPKEAKYYYGTYADLYIDTFGKRKILKVAIHACPTYAENIRCSMKDMPVNMVYPINFCPNCGRDLRKEVRDD